MEIIDKIEEAANMFGYDMRGCEHCEYGIIAEPDIHSVTGPLYLKRAIAASQGSVLFCKCGAGKAAEKHIADILIKIPAQNIRPGSRAILTRVRDDGTIIWSTGNSPYKFVPPSLVEEVTKVVNRPPEMHQEKKEEEDDIF